jgi:tRNA(Ile)-lysidine synthase
MSFFLKNTENTAHRFNLWKRGDTILIAVSGGPDSMCLLDTLFCLAKKYDWKLHIAHVNYRLRKQDSDADEALVRERAQIYDIPLSILHPKKSKETGNLEARLRAIRYEFFEKLRKKLGATSIAVAHTQDDQAETLLLRLIRGAGLSGLGAMRPREGMIIRPLLLTPKDDILTYLKEKGLPFRTDESNADSRFTRNRVRHELLPFLETFNPNIRETLATSTLSLADDAATLSFFLKNFLSIAPSQTPNKESFNTTTFTALNPSLQRALLRSLAERSDTYQQPPSFNEIEEMRKLIGSTKNKIAKKTFRGLKFTRRGDRVSVFIEKNNSQIILS